MTESEDANELVDANVAPINVEMENVASIEQFVDEEIPAPLQAI